MESGKKNGILPFDNLYSAFLLALVGFALYLGWMLLGQFLSIFVLATVLAVLFHPLHERLTALVKGRATLSAGLTTLVIVVAILIPMIFFLISLIGQGVQSINNILEWLNKGEFTSYVSQSRIDDALAWLQDKLPFVDVKDLDLRARFLDLFKSFGQGLLGMGTGLVTNTAGFIFNFVLLVFVVFYFLLDGSRMVDRIKYLIPLAPSQVDAIADGLSRMIRSLLLGTLCIAALQGVVGGVGLAIVGIPALFWGTMIGFASLIPVVGSSIIWLPAAIFLAVTGEWKWGLFLAAWGAIVISSIDTFLRPLFLRNAVKVSILFIFLSVLGGLSVFGAIGLVYGPLILSFILTVLDIYGEEYKAALLGRVHQVLTPEEAKSSGLESKDDS